MALDSEYLKGTVGTVLSNGLAATVSMKPDDPVNFLAQYLLDSVSKEKSSAALAKEVAEAKKALQRKKDAEEVATREAEQTATAVKTQQEREDKRLATHLDGAATADEVYRAVLSYLRTRMGVSAYVALTDLPEKAYVPPPPPPEEGEVAEGGEAAAAEGGEAAAAAEGDGEEAEKPPPKPKYSPTELTYVAATGADEKLLLGKALRRAKKVDEEEGDGEAPPPTGDEGVSFVAVDNFLAGASAPMHVPVAVENRSVKFWYIPRTGAYACAPFADEDGDVVGVLSADTLGLERSFSDEELEMLQSLSVKMGETLMRVERTLGEQNYKNASDLAAEYESTRDALKEELDAAAATEGEEGGDKLASLKAKFRRAAADVGGLTFDKLTFTETRRTLKPEVLAVLKAVQAILVPDCRAKLVEMAWDKFKAELATAALTWGDEIFSKLGSYDPMTSSDAEGFAVAATIATAELDVEKVKADCFPAFLMLQWLREATSLFEAKVEKEKAEAAAAEAAAGADAPAEE